MAGKKEAAVERKRIYIDLQEGVDRRGDKLYYGVKDGVGYIVKRPSVKWEDAGTRNWIFTYKNMDMYNLAKEGKNIKTEKGDWVFPENDGMIWMKDKEFTNKEGAKYIIITGHYSDDELEKSYWVSFGDRYNPNAKPGDVSSKQITLTEKEYTPSNYKKEDNEDKDDGSLPF